MTDNTEPSNIQALVSMCQAGDPHAVETLVRQFEMGVFRVALSVVDDPMEAAEIAQETFIAALKSLASYREKSSFRAWLFTIALNLSRSRLRKRRALERLQTVLAGVLLLEARKAKSLEETVIQGEQEQLVWQALSRLDEKYRLPVILRYFHELPVAEIAQIMNVNEGTLHSRLHHARERLQQELRQQFAEERL